VDVILVLALRAVDVALAGERPAGNDVKRRKAVARGNDADEILAEKGGRA